MLMFLRDHQNIQFRSLMELMAVDVTKRVYRFEVANVSVGYSCPVNVQCS